MHGAGFLVWVVLLVIGVIGSMVSSARKRAQGPIPVPVPQRPRPPQPPPVQPAKPAAAPTPPPPPRTAEPEHPQAHAQHPVSRRLLANRRAVVRAVIAAELLGKPRAFGDEYHLR